MAILFNLAAVLTTFALFYSSMSILCPFQAFFITIYGSIHIK